MRRVFCVLALCGVAPHQAHAGCDASGLPLQSSAVPLTTGSILFQATDSSLSTQTSEIFLFNIATKIQTDISKGWGLSSLRNPHVSPNGNYVVFDAVNAANTRTDIYIWKVGASSFVSLTGSMTNLRYEDPVFTFDGQSLMVKRSFNIVEFPISFANPNAPALGTAKVFTTNGTGNNQYEASGPWMSPDNRYVFFWRGSTTYPPVAVKQIYVPTGAETVFAPGVPNLTYFPVVRDYTTVFYVGHTSQQGNYDQIFLQAPNITGTTPLQLSLNACNSDNSDPAPVNDDYILFSNDSGGAGYRPYLGAIASASVWSLAGIGLGKNASAIVALTYTPYSLAP